VLQCVDSFVPHILHLISLISITTRLGPQQWGAHSNCLLLLLLLLLLLVKPPPEDASRQQPLDP
jgi:hypothetical protein